MNIPVQLRAVFRGHEVRSVNDRDVGWKNIQNGLLLATMEGRFDLLVTADRNMYAQQNLSGRGICILVPPTNRRRDVLALGKQIVQVVDGMAIGGSVMPEMTGAAARRPFDGPGGGS